MRLKIITSSLQNEDLNRWIDSELSGYSSEVDLPEYRKKVGYVIRYSGINGSFQVNNQVLPESFFPKEIKKVIQNRYLLQNISSIEKSAKNDTQSVYNLIDLAGIVQKNSDGYIQCMKLEQVIDKQSFYYVIGQVKNQLISILLDLEKEFGVLDELDIAIEEKNDQEIRDINKEISGKLFFDGKSEVY